MSFLEYSRDFAGVGDIFLRDPARYLPFVQLLDNIMSAESELTRTQKEMIALYSSRLNGCNYCIGSHSCVLSEMATDEDILLSIADDTMTSLSDKLRAVFKLAKMLTLEPENMHQNDIDDVRSAGWSDQTIEDIICVVSTFAFLNRLVDGFGIEGSSDHFRQVGYMVTHQGYTPLVSMIQKKLAHP